MESYEEEPWYKINNRQLVVIIMKNWNTKFFVFAPANICGGGPEALHQLVYYMRQLGMDAYTVYYVYSGFPVVSPVERYEQYGVKVVRYNEIEDEVGNYVIAPENAPWCLNGFRNAQKCIWWLGLIASKVSEGNSFYKMVYWKRRMMRQSVTHARKLLYNVNNCWHLCGSKYAYLDVNNRYDKSRVEYMVEPISLDFLRMDNSDFSTKRENIVLYNPAKPSKIMGDLLERARFKYVPLKGFTPDGLAEMYKEAKLYVDFGDFGGPERMPKEAVYFGCNILVANHNAASNDFDVAIPQKYKVDDNETAEQIEYRIADMLQNYEKQKMDFLPFKLKVEGLEENFINQLKNVFGR